MEITYKNRKIGRVCTNASEAVKCHGNLMAEKIHQRIDEITAVETIEEMLKFRIGGCHPLTGDRAGEYGMNLIHPHRLVFRMVKNVVCILEVVDYH